MTRRGPEISHLMLAGTDNDYSVTRNAGGEQTDPFATFIQCPLGETTGCIGAADSVPSDGSYRLLPGVLHAQRCPPQTSRRPSCLCRPNGNGRREATTCASGAEYPGQGSERIALAPLQALEARDLSAVNQGVADHAS
jgi:hypothetical protein